MGDPIEPLDIRIRRQCLIPHVVDVLVLPLAPEKVELVLHAARTRAQACHDQVHVRDLTVVDPVDPGDLGPIVLGVAVAAVAIEEDPRAALG